MESISIPTGFGSPIVLKGEHVIVAFAVGVVVGVAVMYKFQQQSKLMPIT